MNKPRHQYCERETQRRKNSMFKRMSNNDESRGRRFINATLQLSRYKRKRKAPKHQREGIYKKVHLCEKHRRAVGLLECLVLSSLDYEGSFCFTLSIHV